MGVNGCMSTNLAIRLNQPVILRGHNLGFIN